MILSSNDSLIRGSGSQVKFWIVAGSIKVNLSMIFYSLGPFLSRNVDYLYMRGMGCLQIILKII